MSALDLSFIVIVTFFISTRNLNLLFEELFSKSLSLLFFFIILLSVLLQTLASLRWSLLAGLWLWFMVFDRFLFFLLNLLIILIWLVLIKIFIILLAVIFRNLLFLLWLRLLFLLLSSLYIIMIIYYLWLLNRMRDRIGKILTLLLADDICTKLSYFWK